MEIFSHIEDIDKSKKYFALALGTFDGIHRGHLDVLAKAVREAKKNDALSLVLTFTNHPFTLVDREHLPKILSSSEERRYLLQRAGIDAVIELAFTKDLMELSARDFLLKIVKYINPQLIVVGENYTFGKDREGTSDFLKKEATKHNITVDIRPLLNQEGKIVTSTSIRNILSTGDLAKANRLLSHPFTIIGKVVEGDKRGRTLGFPTANFKVDASHAMPINGIYVVKVRFLKAQEDVYFGVANLGVLPTFQVSERRLEVYIDDFSRDIYDEDVIIEFLTFLREEKKFASIEELKDAIQNDVLKMQEMKNKISE